MSIGKSLASSSVDSLPIPADNDQKHSKGTAMRKALALLVLSLLLLVAACTTTPNSEKPKILCPACGTELDSIFHKHF
jgi:xanthine/uracil permease